METNKATDKQIAFAKKLALELNIDFEITDETTKEQILLFLAENSNKIEYKLSDKQKLVIVQHANEEIKALKDNVDYASYIKCKNFLDEFFKEKVEIKKDV